MLRMEKRVLTLTDVATPKTKQITTIGKNYFILANDTEQKSVEKCKDSQNETAKSTRTEPQPLLQTSDRQTSIRKKAKSTAKTIAAVEKTKMQRKTPMIQREVEKMPHQQDAVM